MEYLLVAPEAIADFLQLLDPFEQCRIMPLIHPTKENRVYYHVSGLSREWVKHVVSDEPTISRNAPTGRPFRVTSGGLTRQVP